MQRPKFVTEEIYHVYNRGVEKRDIFLEEQDYIRFIHDLFEFNDTAPAFNVGYHHSNLSKSHFNNFNNFERKPRKLLVEILAFCLMPNHYHLLLKQRVNNGVTEFMRKIGTGYTNYFNIKNERVGALFQGIFKAMHVSKESHLLYLPHYIHLNPLDLTMPEWREQKLNDVKAALNFLESYRWSSYLDYCNKKNFPSITQRDFIFQIYGSGTSIVDYKQMISGWLKNLNLNVISDVALE